MQITLSLQIRKIPQIFAFSKSDLNSIENYENNGLTHFTNFTSFNFDAHISPISGLSGNWCERKLSIWICTNISFTKTCFRIDLIALTCCGCPSIQFWDYRTTSVTELTTDMSIWDKHIFHSKSPSSISAYPVLLTRNG